MFSWRNKKNVYLETALIGAMTVYDCILGPVVQSIVSLTSSLMTNLLTVVAKVFSNTLIFLLQKSE